MKVLLFELLVICTVGALLSEANAQPEEMGFHHVGRRYAESTIASEISKIMDSMVQKNFVEFLLNQKHKRSKYVAAYEGDPEEPQYNELLRLHVQEKQRTKL
uniref:Uncharacterized protein n=1 Tax=Mastacembelus armatus TaxID=205130 RepID=A0A3Q3LAH3_9TELE